MASGDKFRIGPPNLKDKKNFSDLGSTDTAVRSADVDEDTRLLWSEGAVPLQRDDDNDDDGFVSPLKATVNFEDDTKLRQHHEEARRLATYGLKDDRTTTVLGGYESTVRRLQRRSFSNQEERASTASTKTWRQRRHQNGVNEMQRRRKCDGSRALTKMQRQRVIGTRRNGRRSDGRFTAGKRAGDDEDAGMSFRRLRFGCAPPPPLPHRPSKATTMISSASIRTSMDPRISGLN